MKTGSTRCELYTGGAVCNLRLPCSITQVYFNTSGSQKTIVRDQNGKIKRKLN